MAKRAAASKSKANIALEEGVCIVCGNTVRGIPAQPDILIKAARKIRGILRAESHTVVCNGHLPEAVSRRAKFEKSLFGYKIAAAVFFLLAMAGPLAFGQVVLGMAIPGAIGALFILLIAYLQYYPEFTSNPRP